MSILTKSEKGGEMLNLQVIRAPVLCSRFMNDNPNHEEEDFGTNLGAERLARRRAPLALHIRRLRQWHGETGIKQKDLAKIIGMSDRQLRIYEHARVLPRSVEPLLSIALALGVPMEWLINPNRLEKLRQQINERCNVYEREHCGREGSGGIV